MRRFSSLVRERRKEFTSDKQASDIALNEFNSAKRSSLDRNVERSPSFMEPGKIYTFQYSPKLRNELDYYDKNPLVLAVERRKLKDGRFIDIGINLNFLPFNAKVALIDRMDFNYRNYLQRNKFMAANRATDQSQLPINWQVAKNLLGRAGKFALRSYYPSRRTNTYVFSYEEWVDLMFLDIKDIEGASLGQIYKLYNRK